MRRLGVVDVLFLAWTASLALLFLEPQEPNLPAYQYGKPASADYKPGGSGCEPRVLASIRDNGKAATERDRCSEAAEEHRLKSDDLVQQTRAANADEAQTAINFELARLAFWGTIGGFLTLIAAALAAYFARQAAEAGVNSYEAFVAAEDASLHVEFPAGAIYGSTNAEGVKTEAYALTAVITNIGRSAALVHKCTWGDHGITVDKTLKPDDPPLRFDYRIQIESLHWFDFHITYSTPLLWAADLILTVAPSKYSGHHVNESRGRVTKRRLLKFKEQRN